MLLIERWLTLILLLNMHIRSLIPGILTILMFSCTQQQSSTPKNALETGREFIRASLDGKFEQAESFISKDSQNLELFESYKSYYNKLPGDKKEHYKSASYTILKYLELNDSTVIITYSNSYMNTPMDIKIMQQDNKWNVDFKFAYLENSPIN